ncbi:MAG: OmpA family protein [Gammaproteobacteria bacterium]|jgi:outer membrane protein OmpA-like peptidoglycan-associated protein
MKLNRISRPTRIVTWAAIGCLGLVAAGCTTNPYTGEQEVSRTAIGAGIGAITGMIIGNNVGGNQDRNRYIGAVIGGLAGGAIGNYMDQQQNALRRELQGTGVSVQRSGNNLILVMPSDITFPIDQYAVEPQFYPVLNSVSKVFKHYDKTMIDISGYTDSTGTEQHNQWLSEQRAVSVGKYLISQGVQSFRIKAVGYGENYPVASNSTPQGRSQNRRVTITIVPVQQQQNTYGYNQG